MEIHLERFHPKSQPRSMSCSQCGADDPAHECADCSDVYYCSSKCQISHWADGHATVCQARLVGNPMDSRRHSPSSGIHVTGVARMTLAPDIAVLELSVRVVSVVLSDARKEAAREMDAMRRALSRNDVTDSDVATTDYSISVVREEAGGVWKRVGYRVSNFIQVTVRDIDAVGDIIDAVATGDNTRVHGIRFAIEHPEEYADTLRAEAGKDAHNRAGQIAESMGERLGGLISATEVSGGGRRRASRTMMSVEMDAPSTPVSAGDMEVRAEVQAMFAIL